MRQWDGPPIHLDRASFDALPRYPTNLLAHGAWVTVRANKSGTITKLNEARLDTIRKLASYRDEYMPLNVGSHVAMTIDACTIHGCVNLVHEDEAQLCMDYMIAQGLVEQGLYEIE